MFKSNLCPRCQGKMKDSFDFCPYCGLDVRNPEADAEDFGLLGKNEFTGNAAPAGGGFGVTDKLIQSIFNNLVKSLDKQMRSMPEVENLPNGIRIQFGTPQKKPTQKPATKTITEDQVKRMAGLPRTEAKTDIRRLSDKVVYELKAPGIGSVEDVFVSKLASGYEVKAIGKKKVFVNNLPIDLPLKSYSVNDKGLVVEFGLE